MVKKKKKTDLLKLCQRIGNRLKGAIQMSFAGFGTKKKMEKMKDS